MVISFTYQLANRCLCFDLELSQNNRLSNWLMRAHVALLPDSSVAVQIAENNY
jgi:hypothetical protein